MSKGRVLPTCLMLTLLAMTSVFAHAPRQALARQDEGPPKNEAGQDDQKKADDEKKKDEEKEEDEDQDEILAITGGTVHTVSSGVWPKANIICVNGKITAIGKQAAVPEGAEVIDATGRHVYPGLVSVESRGIFSDGDPRDGTDVYSFTMMLGLAAGITTSATGNDAAKLTFGGLDDMVVARNLFENISYSTRNPRARYTLRQDLDKVRQYLRDVAAHEEAKRRDPEAKAPDDSWVRGKYQTYMKLMKGEAVATVNANDAHELLEYCELAENYGIRLVIRGAVEGWTVADELARVGVSVILSPRDRIDPDERMVRPNGSTIENAAILYNHGVVVAVTPVGSLFGPGSQISLGGLAGRDLAHLPLEAAFAVRGGMSNEQAVRTITLDAARILGIDDRVGSIEVGKDADFVITDGDLLFYQTLAQQTIVNGKLVYDKATEGIYSDIRPEGEGTTTAPDEYWPRRLGQAWTDPTGTTNDENGPAEN